MMVDLVSDFFVGYSSVSTFLAIMALYGSFIWMAIDASLIPTSFWLMSRPRVKDGSTWHVDSSFSILLWEARNIELNILHQTLPLTFQHTIKLFNRQQQGIRHESRGFKFELCFEDIFRLW